MWSLLLSLEEAMPVAYKNHSFCPVFVCTKSWTTTLPFSCVVGFRNEYSSFIHSCIDKITWAFLGLLLSQSYMSLIFVIL